MKNIEKLQTKCKDYRIEKDNLSKKIRRLNNRLKTSDKTNQELKNENEELKAKLVSYEKKINELNEEVGRLKENMTEISMKNNSNQLDDSSKGCVATHIKRYTYTELIVRIALLYYCYCGCSLRSVAKILEINEKVLYPMLGISDEMPKYQTPAYTTISTWIQKCGLDTLTNDSKRSFESTCKIIDESISVNGEKLLCILDLEAKHSGEAPKYEDARICSMSINKSHTGEDISEEINSVMENCTESEKQNTYFLGDGGTNLIKGATIAGYTYHIDCGHSIANILKSTYADCDDFKELFKTIGSTRRYALSDVAYLMPPSMRANSRFMNIIHWVIWAKLMNENSFKLNDKEKYMYSFLTNNACLVDELYEVLSTTNSILKILKNNGLCTSTVKSCMEYVNRLIEDGERPKSVGEKISKYLTNELSKMSNPSVPINISSDLIESVFGYTKTKIPKSKRFGYTAGVVLLLPLKLRCERTENITAKDVKLMLENNRMADVAKWKNETLKPSQSQMQKRKDILSKDTLPA